MRGIIGPFVLGADLNGAVHMGEHPDSPRRWSYRWSGLLMSKTFGIGVLYRIAEVDPSPFPVESKERRKGADL